MDEMNKYIIRCPHCMERIQIDIAIEDVLTAPPQLESKKQ